MSEALLIELALTAQRRGLIAMRAWPQFRLMYLIQQDRIRT